MNQQRLPRRRKHTPHTSSLDKTSTHMYFTSEMPHDHGNLSGELAVVVPTTVHAAKTHRGGYKNAFEQQPAVRERQALSGVT